MTRALAYAWMLNHSCEVGITSLQLVGWIVAALRILEHGLEDSIKKLAKSLVGLQSDQLTGANAVWLGVGSNDTSTALTQLMLACKVTQTCSLCWITADRTDLTKVWRLSDTVPAVSSPYCPVLITWPGSVPACQVLTSAPIDIQSFHQYNFLFFKLASGLVDTNQFWQCLRWEPRQPE